jgi:RNA polymerase sigma-70 factor (ECF subfamily)
MDPSEDPAYAAALDRALAEGRRCWPAVALDRDRFADHLRTLAVPLAAVEKHGADLFLAAACALGDAAAVVAFDGAFMPLAREALGRLRLPEHLRDEALQLARIRLLAGPSPKVALFAGAGPLSSWVRVAATRVGLNLLQATGGPAGTGDDAEGLSRLVAATEPPDREATRRLDRAIFVAAFERSLTRQSAREKTLLRKHFVDGLGIDAIGVVYRVHRATAARWLAAIRSQVFAELRRDLAQELRAASSDLRSLVNLFESDLRLSLERILPGPGRE